MENMDAADVIEIQCEEQDEELGMDTERQNEENMATEKKPEKDGSPDKQNKMPKDDFEDYELDSDVGENEETSEDAEKHEEEILNMPSLHTVMADLGNLKQGRRVLVYPLKVNELGHSKMLETISKDTCEEIKLHFVRPKDKPLDWNGFLLMHFSSRNAAKLAVDNVKMIREDLDVKSEEETAYANRVMEQWVRDEKGQKRWTDTLVLVKNVAESVTIEQLQAIFEEAEDIIFRKTYERKKECEKDVKEAYVVYRNMGMAQAAAKELAAKDIELEGLKLKIFKYHCPSDNSPRGLLKLKERRLLLKYIEKLSETLEKEKLGEEEFKAPIWCSKRLDIAKIILERDDKARTVAGLTTPMLDELRSMTGIKIIRGKDRKDSLINMGVLDRPRRFHRLSDYRDRDRKRSGYDSRNSGSSRNSSLLGNPPSLISLNPIVPPLLIMQQNMGLMGNLMRQQTTNMAMMGMASSMMGFDSSGGRRSSGMSDSDAPRKLLRLDERGSYHFDRNRSHGSGDSKSKGSGSSRGGKPVSLLDL